MRTERMEAGREMDALVAERVMGLRVTRGWRCGQMPSDGAWDVPDNPDGTTDSGKMYGWIERGEPHPVFDIVGKDGLLAWREVVPFYSTEIAAAWEIPTAPLLAEHHFEVGRAVGLDGRAHGWYARVANAATCYADTAPLAICRAALAALASAHPEAPTLERAATGAAEED